MIKKFIRYLYQRYGEPDVIGMTRIQLGLYYKPVDWLGIALPDQQVFNQNCDKAIKDGYIMRIIDELVDEFRNEAIGGSRDISGRPMVTDEEENLRRFRYMIYGLHLFTERLFAYAGKSLEERPTFDKHKPL